LTKRSGLRNTPRVSSKLFRRQHFRNPFDDDAVAEHLAAQQSDAPLPAPKPGKHARLRQAHRHLHLPADLRPTARRAGRTIGVSPLDPELARIVSLCRRGPHPKTKRVGPLPVDKQSHEWQQSRDAYAAKNYDLAHRAAAKQWERNRHLEREIVPCVYCIGRKCARCRGRKQYKCQPDLECLAYIGLLEAIRAFDPNKAHCLSSYAVHTMKQSMLTLLRQTPVFYPQDLLRDRRAVATLRKKLNADPSEEQAADALIEMERAASEKAKKRTLRADELIALRARLRSRGLVERARLALNCYYGNERKSVEDLYERYVQRTERGGEKRQRRAKVAGLLEVLCVEQPVAAPESEDLSAALRELSVKSRAEVECYLRGRGEISSTTMDHLREVML
jgi:hypothetical protein